MDNNQFEIAALKDVEPAATLDLIELPDVQLALVGGGVGEITTY